MAEQCDIKAWPISLAEQSWKNWPPREDIFWAVQDWVLAERNGWPPLKNAPGTPMLSFSNLYLAHDHEDIL